VGVVNAFRLMGLRCYFGSNDHFPQHFEVLKRGCWIIRVFFLRSSRTRGLSWEYKKQWGNHVTAAEEAQLLRMVLAHKKRLLAEWKAKVNAGIDSTIRREDQDSDLRGGMIS
jgi:hypothetical protein